MYYKKIILKSIGNKSGYNIVDSSNNVGVGAFNLYNQQIRK